MARGDGEGGFHMAIGDAEDDPKWKWKHKELRTPIKWTGPPPFPRGLLDAIAPSQTEEDEHQRARKIAASKVLEEQLQKLPLLAQEHGIEVPAGHVGIVAPNDGWVLTLLLELASKVVPGFRTDFGARRGARKWDDVAQAELIADV